MKLRICVVGIGYIGLPIASIFALNGHKVSGVDTDIKKIKDLNEGLIYTKEPKLKETLNEVIKNKNLVGNINIEESDVFIICVPTPVTNQNKPNLDYLIESINSIIPVLRKDNIIIIESTCPIGTTEEIIKPILEKENFVVGEDIYLGYSPERVMPGNIIYELQYNNRIIGGINKKSSFKIKEVYESFVKGEIYITDLKTAEACKLVENIYRDVNIALSNELAIISESLGLNIWEIITVCNQHPRVNLHNPGIGVGGHCIPVDPWFLINQSKELSSLIQKSRNINDNMPFYIFNKINKILETKNKDKKVAILGATYKPNVDDIRDSPSIKLYEILKENDFKVSIHDPYILSNDINNDLMECCKDSDLIVLSVSHDYYKYINLNKIKDVMKGNIILDTNNFLDRNKIEELGFDFEVIGIS